LRSHHEFHNLFDFIVTAESPSANLHFKFIALFLNCVTLFLAAEIKELLITKLVNVLGSSNIDSKFVYAELHIKVHTIQEIVDFLDVPLAL